MIQPLELEKLDLKKLELPKKAIPKHKVWLLPIELKETLVQDPVAIIKQLIEEDKNEENLATIVPSVMNNPGLTYAQKLQILTDCDKKYGNMVFVKVIEDIKKRKDSTSLLDQLSLRELTKIAAEIKVKNDEEIVEISQIISAKVEYQFKNLSTIQRSDIKYKVAYLLSFYSNLNAQAMYQLEYEILSQEWMSALFEFDPGLVRNGAKQIVSHTQNQFSALSKNLHIASYHSDLSELVDMVIDLSIEDKDRIMKTEDGKLRGLKKFHTFVHKKLEKLKKNKTVYDKLTAYLQNSKTLSQLYYLFYVAYLDDHLLKSKPLDYSKGMINSQFHKLYYTNNKLERLDKDILIFAAGLQLLDISTIIKMNDQHLICEIVWIIETSALTDLLSSVSQAGRKELLPYLDKLNEEIRSKLFLVRKALIIKNKWWSSYGTFSISKSGYIARSKDSKTRELYILSNYNCDIQTIKNVYDFERKGDYLVTRSVETLGKKRKHNEIYTTIYRLNWEDKYEPIWSIQGEPSLLGNIEDDRCVAKVSINHILYSFGKHLAWARWGALQSKLEPNGNYPYRSLNTCNWIHEWLLEVSVFEWSDKRYGNRYDHVFIDVDTWKKVFKIDSLIDDYNVVGKFSEWLIWRKTRWKLEFYNKNGELVFTHKDSSYRSDGTFFRNNSLQFTDFSEGKSLVENGAQIDCIDTNGKLKFCILKETLDMKVDYSFPRYTLFPFCNGLARVQYIRRDNYREPIESTKWCLFIDSSGEVVLNKVKIGDKEETIYESTDFEWWYAKIKLEGGSYGILDIYGNFAEIQLIIKESALKLVDDAIFG